MKSLFKSILTILGNVTAFTVCISSTSCVVYGSEDANFSSPCDNNPCAQSGCTDASCRSFSDKECLEVEDPCNTDKCKTWCEKTKKSCLSKDKKDNPCNEDCIKVLDEKDLIECMDEVDCSKDGACDLPECKDSEKCQSTVYGPSFTEEQFKECCGEDTESEEYKTCVEDYTKNLKCPKE